MTAQVKSKWSVINHSNCQVTDSMSTNYKNDMWNEIAFADAEVRTVRMLQVW